jgi:hypothetical protein
VYRRPDWARRGTITPTANQSRLYGLPTIAASFCISSDDSVHSPARRPFPMSFFSLWSLPTQSLYRAPPVLEVARRLTKIFPFYPWRPVAVATSHGAFKPAREGNIVVYDGCRGAWVKGPV